jgi:VRR-NUC domain
MFGHNSRIFCTPQLRALWPNPLARRWLAAYPQLFDRDDFRLTQTQPKNHFCEWFTAVFLFQRDGALSLVEKYGGTAHSKKGPLFERILTPRQSDMLWMTCADFHCQAPDLLVYSPDFGQFWFAEAKGPRDRLSDKQRRSHQAISRQLKTHVEVFDVVW